MNGDQTLNLIIKAKDEASATLDKFKGRMEDLTPSFQKMAAIGTASFAAIGAFAFKMVESYSDAEAQTALTNQALSNSFKNLSEKDLGGLKKALGTTQDALKGLQDTAQKAGAAAIKMGFDDETAANSFSKLFGVTKNTTKAQNELTIAMDLARYKGISLEEATQKLIMVHSGSTKELKLMGLAIDDNATAEQNLAAIHKQTADSAVQFSQTTKGAMEVLGVEVDNLKENIGASLAPIFVQLLQKVEPLVAKFSDWAAANPDLIAKLIVVAGVVAGMVTVVGTLGALMPAIITGVTGLGTALAFFAATPLGLTITGLVALAAALTKAIDLFYDLKVVSSQASEASLQATQTQKGLREELAKTTDPKKKAAIQSAIYTSQQSQEVTDAVANASFLKKIGVAWGLASYETGGMVGGARGTAVPIIAHGGETIIPAGQQGAESGNTVYNFHFNGAVAGDEGIKLIIKQTIDSLNRRSSLKTMGGV